jgi:hypothetical protein
MGEKERIGIISQIAYKVHPSIGKLYDGHTRFFNDGIMELICLIIANVFIFFFSVGGIVGWTLVLLNLAIATPITFCIKYLGHKYWVWAKNADS